MSIFQAIVMGLIQGLTEFIPVSSSAHLRLVPALLGWKDPGAAFTAVIQLGTLLAVLIYFFPDLVKLTVAFFQGIFKGRPFADHDSRLAWYIGIGTIPVVVLGLAFKHFIETEARSLWIISFTLIFVAVLLMLAESYAARNEGREIADVNLTDAVAMGLGQSLALIPGMSRSGSTIMVGLFRRLSREAAARFSFLLSIPAILGSGLLEMVKERKHLMEVGVTPTIIATVISFVVGWASIWFLLRYLRTHTTYVFIWYRIALGVILIALLATHVISPFQ
ncbi:MAG TPA: undecaprenyl-diphosphate phosphatase [Thermoanaerobaculia bacterium]|nr:undecaprenyl-diphosphate phosphatase [Thermoanaerobaculia bacterium]